MVKNTRSSAQKLHIRDFTRKLYLRTTAWCAALSVSFLVLLTLGSIAEHRGQAAVFADPTRAPEAAPPVTPPTEQQRLQEARLELLRSPSAGRDALVSLYGHVLDGDVLHQVVALIVGTDAPEWSGGTQGQFLRELAPAVLATARQSSVPPSVTLAQAILESGWGRSGVAREANNLFGVKASPSEKGYSPSGGSRYRVYPDWEASLAHHNELLSTSPRYAASRAYTDDWQRFLKSVAPIYATSRTYVRQVSDLVQRYRLHRWDSMVYEASQRIAALSVAPAADHEEDLAVVARTVTP